MTKSIFDASLWVLIASNIASIVLAVTQNWSMSEILWVYWGQSVIIGVVNVIRMLSLKEFSTKNFKSNGVRPPENETTKRSTAAFFALHYGLFHLVYMIFLLQGQPLTDMNLDQILFTLMLIMAFLGSHGFSFMHNKNKDFKHKKPNIGTLFFYPYLRIVPMHIIIIAGGAFGASITMMVIFMVMKTFADAGMHMIEHHIFQKKAKAQ